MALALERWSRSGLWVISRGDAEFPKRLKRHFRHAAPPLLYGVGRKELLDMGGLAIVGSRDATEAALDFTRQVVTNCAQEGLGVVSGGARGVDAAAMQGAIDAGGRAMGVLANDLLKASVHRQNRLGLQEGRLVLVSPFYPEAGFNAGHAMGRNKYIYALSDRALVVDSALGSGGTWAGALDALKQQWVPLYVRMPGNGPGNAALVEKGGIAFSFAPGQREGLLDFLERTASSTHKLSEPAPALSTAQSVSAGESRHAVASPVALDMYADFLVKLDLALAAGPLSEEEVAQRLGLEKAQAKAWLRKAAESGRVEKQMKPIRYLQSLQASLLG